MPQTAFAGEGHKDHAPSQSPRGDSSPRGEPSNMSTPRKNLFTHFILNRNLPKHLCRGYDAEHILVYAVAAVCIEEAIAVGIGVQVKG